MNEYSRLSRTRREQEIKKKKKSKIRRIFLLIIFLLVLYGGYTLFNLFMNLNNGYKESENTVAVSYTHLTLPTITTVCRSRWSPYH